MALSLRKLLFLFTPFFILLIALIFYLSGFEVEFKQAHGERKNINYLPENQEQTVADLEPENLALENGDSLQELEVAESKDQKIPSDFLLEVPFAPQSPYAIWDERDEESCEEASLVIVHYFWQKKNLNKEKMREELDRLIDFQVSHYGDYKDTDSKETAKLAQDYYGYQNVEVVYDITVDDLKERIVAGYPVIIPAAGRLLYNPNFTPPGPLYHNLVLIGFNEDGFITNDPGTRRGEHYFYPYRVLDDAIHDFPGSKEEIEQGRKAMIIVK